MILIEYNILHVGVQVLAQALHQIAWFWKRKKLIILHLCHGQIITF
jgi:hypothetical protein